MLPDRLCWRGLTGLGAGWFLVALFVGETELLTVLPPLVIPITVLGLTAVLLWAYARSRCFRSRMETIPAAALIALHLTRFVGFYFLRLHSMGALPGSFAIKAGWGDIIVAVGALFLVLIPVLRRSSRAVLAWNVIGLIDIVWVVGSAARFVASEPHAMSPFMHLPLSFLPTFLVPLIIFSHLVICHRWIRERQARAQGQPFPSLLDPLASSGGPG